MELIRVLLVEDEPYILSEIVQLIERHDRLALYATATNYQQARSILFDDYDLLVVDKQLPDGSGIELIRQLNKVANRKKTLVMTVFDDEQSVTDAIAAGADGYFVKQDPHIEDAMCAVMSDGNPLSPSVVKYFIRRTEIQAAPAAEFTVRELHTLQGLADGLKYDEIAQRLGVSRHTIPDYIKTLYRKLGVHDKSSAVYKGVSSGLISANKEATTAQLGGS